MILKRRALLFIAMLSLLLVNSMALAMETMFYSLGSTPGNLASNQATIKSLTAHFSKINIIAPQAYSMDKHGMIWGSIDPRLIKFANKHNIKIMPLVTNQSFNQSNLHTFLHSDTAQQRAIKALVSLCKENHYYGIQFDIENVFFDDKNAYTNFYRKAADALHKNGFAISVAIVPRTRNGVTGSDYKKWRIENWAGAYDYKAIGKVSDFVTLMTYDQHTIATTPGPVAGFPWTVTSLKYALRYIPANKILLGIPLYSSYWFTVVRDSKTKQWGRSLGYNDLKSLVAKYNVHLKWDNTNKVPYALFNVNNMNRYVYVEDAQSAAEKIKLVKQYHLRGIAAWRIGMEDPALWNVIPGRTKSPKTMVPGT